MQLQLICDLWSHETRSKGGKGDYGIGGAEVRLQQPATTATYIREMEYVVNDCTISINTFLWYIYFIVFGKVNPKTIIRFYGSTPPFIYLQTPNHPHICLHKGSRWKQEKCDVVDAIPVCCTVSDVRAARSALL